MDELNRINPKEQDPNIRNKNFDEVCLGYTEEEAKKEASRCLNCKNALCQKGCPVSIKIPQFIEEIKNGNFEFKINSNEEQVDALINEKVDGWKTSRMAKVDLMLIRLALYEMYFDSSIDLEVAINEAVELAKKINGEIIDFRWKWVH